RNNKSDPASSLTRLSWGEAPPPVRLHEIGWPPRVPAKVNCLIWSPRFANLNSAPAMICLLYPLKIPALTSNSISLIGPASLRSPPLLGPAPLLAGGLKISDFKNGL